jgi:hypothetical protein
MKRGYFDDFRDLKETQGRMFEASQRLIPASSSTLLPTMAVRSHVTLHNIKKTLYYIVEASQQLIPASTTPRLPPWMCGTFLSR